MNSQTCDHCSMPIEFYFELEDLVSTKIKYAHSCKDHTELAVKSLYKGPTDYTKKIRFFTNENPQWQSWPPPKPKEKKQTGRKPKQNPS